MQWTKEDFQKLKNIDTPTFERFYHEVKNSVYRFISLKTNYNQHDTDDIMSETFQSAIKSIGNLKDIEKRLSWILNIANRRFIDHLRKKYKHKRKEEKLQKVYVEEVENDPGQIYQRKKEEEYYRLAMESIKPEYKMVLNLKYVDNKTEKEIGKQLNKTIGSIEGLLHRARDALKKELITLMKYR